MDSLIETYGYVALFPVVMLGCAGLPLPSVAILAAAAVYAGATHHLDIGTVIAVAAVAAMVGNLIGYGLGRTYGPGLLERYGHRVGLTESRLYFGQYVFARYAGWAVVIGRFVGPLRAWMGLLAGMNEMPWPLFVCLSSLGALVWALVWGLGPYLVGTTDLGISLPGGLLTWVLLAGAATIVLRQTLRRLWTEAERARAGSPSAPPSA